jgi:hypothetical protein
MHHDAPQPKVLPFQETAWFNGSLFFICTFFLCVLIGMFVLIALTGNHLYTQCGSSFSFIPITLFLVSGIALILLMIYLGSKSIFRSATLEKADKFYAQQSKSDKVDVKMLKEFVKTGCLSVALLDSCLRCLHWVLLCMGKFVLFFDCVENWVVEFEGVEEGCLCQKR